MIKVINLISLLFASAVMKIKENAVVHFQIGSNSFSISLLAIALSIILTIIVASAIMFSKRETKELMSSDQPEKETETDTSSK
jgi:hypothetical protein